MRPRPVLEHVPEQVNIAPPATPDVIDISSARPSAPTSKASSGVTTESLEREYGDPTIARDAKAAIQRVLDAKIDQSKYQVRTILCHKQNCQIFSNAKVPGADSDWPPIVEEIVQELATVSFRNPETGEELKPTLQSISRGTRKDTVTVTIIWLR
jgi:hypothetical protein